MRNLLLACFTAALLASCNKEQTMDVPKNRARMLIGENTTTAADAQPSKWKTKEYKVYVPKGDGTFEVKTDMYPECLKDDNLQFFQNYFGKHLPGGNTCVMNENDVYNTRWQLTSDEDTFNCYDCDRFFGERTFIAELTDCSESSFTIKYQKTFVINNVLDTLTVEHILSK